MPIKNERIWAGYLPNGQFTIKLDGRPIVTVWTIVKGNFVDYETTERIQLEVTKALVKLSKRL